MIYTAISLQPLAIQQKINSDTTEAIKNGLTKHGKMGRELDGNPKPRKRQRLSRELENQDYPMSTIPSPASYIQQPENQEETYHANESNGEKIIL